MVHFPNTYAPGMSGQTINGRPVAQMDWSAEITAGPENQPRAASDTGLGGMSGGAGTGSMTGMAGGMAGMNSGMGEPSGGMMAPGRQMFSQNGDAGAQNESLNMQRTGLPDEVIEAPTTVDEAYRGSLKAMLARYVGSYVVATFLVGTQGTVSWEGTLFDVGNDFVTIYQQPRDRYIVSDIYSLKYIEFYDTRRRELCETLIQQGGWQSNN